MRLPIQNFLWPLVYHACRAYLLSYMQRRIHSMIDYEGLTATQVAARLQCSEQSIRLWVKKRGFPGPISRGFPHKWSWAEVESWCRTERPWVLHQNKGD